MMPLSNIPGQSPNESRNQSLRASLTQAARFWEPRRLLYNFILAVVVLTWVLATWPHFRPALTLASLLLLAVLAAIANICYCSAYALDLVLQRSTRALSTLRWTLWVAGTLFAILLANYWISDEIYPFVH